MMKSTVKAVILILVSSIFCIVVFLALFSSQNHSIKFHTRFQSVDEAPDVWLDTLGPGYVSAAQTNNSYRIGVNLGSGIDEFISFRYTRNGKISVILSKLLITRANGTTNMAAYVDRNADGVPESRLVSGEGWEAFFQGEFFSLKNAELVASVSEEDGQTSAGKIEVNGEMIDIILEDYKWRKK